MSGVVFEENVSLESVFANNVVLTSVILPDLSKVNTLSENAFCGTNPDVLFL